MEWVGGVSFSAMAPMGFGFAPARGPVVKTPARVSPPSESQTLGRPFALGVLALPVPRGKSAKPTKPRTVAML